MKINKKQTKIESSIIKFIRLQFFSQIQELVKNQHHRGGFNIFGQKCPSGKLNFLVHSTDAK